MTRYHVYASVDDMLDDGGFYERVAVTDGHPALDGALRRAAELLSEGKAVQIVPEDVPE